LNSDGVKYSVPLGLENASMGVRYRKAYRRDVMSADSRVERSDKRANLHGISDQ